MFQFLAAYLQDSPELVRIGPELVRLEVVLVKTGPENVVSLRTQNRGTNAQLNDVSESSFIIQRILPNQV